MQVQSMHPNTSASNTGRVTPPVKPASRISHATPLPAPVPSQVPHGIAGSLRLFKCKRDSDACSSGQLVRFCDLFAPPSPPLFDSHSGLAELQNSLEGLLHRSPETCGDSQSPSSQEITAAIPPMRVLNNARRVLNNARKMQDVDLQCEQQKWTLKADLAKAQTQKGKCLALHIRCSCYTCLDTSAAKSHNGDGASLYAGLVRNPLSPERELQKRLAQQAAVVAHASTVQQVLAQGPPAATHAIRCAAVQIGSPTVIAGNQVASLLSSDIV